MPKALSPKPQEALNLALSPKLNPTPCAQVDRMLDEHGIYLTKDGRMSMAGPLHPN